ncbi:MAG: hypothetical protein NXH71_10805 [Erythrobacteraceae bacterium]|jgi:hypothetical protein|nr:hypothetical protein [Erythrobacteraceae bacterium]
MSVNEQDMDEQARTPIVPGSPLACALDDFAVPELSAGFAEKVAAAAQARPPATLAPLPKLRRSGGGRGWRLGRRIAIGVTCFGALATAAAATGLIERFDLPVPSPEKVWASIIGKPATPAPVAAPVAVQTPADPAPAGLAPVRIEGPIDTPEELGEAFRRIEEVRQGRIAARRQRIDQRIESEIERRRAAGQRVPTPEEEARLRQRIEEARVRREGARSDRIEARREELLERVEQGEALARKDVMRPLREDARTPEQREVIERLRRMSPDDRREALRQLPPGQRRELMEAWRQRREERMRAAPDEGKPPATERPAQDMTPPLSASGTPPAASPR